MSSSRSIRRDDFDIESNGRYRKSSEKLSGSRRRSCSRYRDGSRSRSRSAERNGRGRRGGLAMRRGRYASRSPSRSRSRSRGFSRHHYDAVRSTRGRRYSRSRSNIRSNSSRSPSRSRSRSPANYRCNRGRDYEYAKDYQRKNSKSRSRSRSSSQYGDYSKGSQLQNKDDMQDLSSTGLCDLQQIQENLEDLPLPKPQKEDEVIKPVYQFNDDEPIDRERIHREMEEKLRQTLAKEGKVYPPPKPEASHPVFANDGSFLELFKKMQQQQQSQNPLRAVASSSASAAAIVPNSAVPILATSAVNSSAAPYLASTVPVKSAPPPPMVGRRKGGKILKTGVVAKPKVQTATTSDPKDLWSLYLAEVNKYKNTACESEQGNRPLVK